MQADVFTQKIIELDEEVPDYGNDPAIPIMVIDIDSGKIFSIKNINIERHDPPGYTVWIRVEEM